MQAVLDAVASAEARQEAVEHQEGEAVIVVVSAEVVLEAAVVDSLDLVVSAEVAAEVHLVEEVGDIRKRRDSRDIG